MGVNCQIDGGMDRWIAGIRGLKRAGWMGREEGLEPRCTDGWTGRRVVEGGVEWIGWRFVGKPHRSMLLPGEQFASGFERSKARRPSVILCLVFEV